MVTIKLSIKDILCLEKISILLEKLYEKEYKEIWTPFVERKLDTTMQPNNVKDKYDVSIFQEGKKKVSGHLPLAKSGKFSKTVFHFLKAAKENR